MATRAGSVLPPARIKSIVPAHIKATQAVVWCTQKRPAPTGYLPFTLCHNNLPRLVQQRRYSTRPRLHPRLSSARWAHLRGHTTAVPRIAVTYAELSPQKAR